MKAGLPAQPITNKSTLAKTCAHMNVQLVNSSRSMRTAGPDEIFVLSDNPLVKISSAAMGGKMRSDRVPSPRWFMF